MSKAGHCFCDAADAGCHRSGEVPQIVDTNILAASLRHPLHVVQAAQLGADVATLPPALFDRLLAHPLTDLGLERFLADWKKGKS